MGKIILLKNFMTKASLPDAYLVNKGEEAETKALVLARQLRDAKLAVELDSSGASFGKQFKRADKSGATWAIVLGDDEVHSGKVRLKKLNCSNDSSDSDPKEFLASSSDLDGLLALLSS